MKTLWIVVAEEDDYYPIIETIGVFMTKADAEAYAAKQPREFDWGLYRPQPFSYEVKEIPFDPVAPWSGKVTT